MKILTLHCDYIKFKAKKKALKSVKDLSDEEKEEKHIEECLVVLMAAEKGDSEKELKDTVEAIKKNAEQVNTKEIVVYPYAHLSNNLSSPKEAEKYLKRTKEELEKQGFNVTNAPFGYYKEFGLKVKGHPLSELSKEFGSKKVMVDENVEEEDDYDSKQLLKEIGKVILDTSKIKEHDHRVIGKQMDLFSFSGVAPGMVFWHNNGLIVRNEIIEYWRELHKNQGYQEIKTPQIMDSKLWKISGHWDKYKENNFSTQYEKRKFLIKPMNCPGGMIVYKNTPKSYKEFPLRVAELGEVHRVELSGVLSGLFRVIQFTQDDAHIFCTEEQIEKEIENIMDLALKIYDKFGLKLDHIELSTRPKKRIGEDNIWDLAEKKLEKVLQKKNVKFKINPGDGAFYGPKIDYHIKDSLERTWQLGTIQLDFAMPKRFELEYTDKDNKKKQPVMLHRTIYGSLERFMGILIESSKGWLPTWLVPIQVRMINFTDRNTDYAKKIMEKINEEISGLRIDTDFTSSTVQSKVKQASLMRIPYVIVIGDKEEKDNSLAVRVRGNKGIMKYSLEDFISKIKTEIQKRE